jgi:hypothetical protein
MKRRKKATTTDARIKEMEMATVIPLFVARTPSTTTSSIPCRSIPSTPYLWVRLSSSSSLTFSLHLPSSLLQRTLFRSLDLLPPRPPHPNTVKSCVSPLFHTSRLSIPLTTHIPSELHAEDFEKIDIVEKRAAAKKAVQGLKPVSRGQTLPPIHRFLLSPSLFPPFKKFPSAPLPPRLQVRPPLLSLSSHS